MRSVECNEKGNIRDGKLSSNPLFALQAVIE